MARRKWRNSSGRLRRPLGLEHLEEKIPLAFGELLATVDNPSALRQALAESAFSLAADGDFIVTGVPRADIAGAIDAGSVDVRDRVTGDLIATLSNPTPSANDRFGYSVDIHGDTVVVGTHLDDAAGADAGAVYVFDLSSGALRHTLLNPAPSAADQFGFDVVISGNIILVGAPVADNFGQDAGAVFIFDATTGDVLHTLSNPNNPVADFFGSAVAISGDAVAVGAYRNDTGASDGGAVYLYDAATGALQRQLVNPTPANFEYFGYSLALSGDDLVVGAYRDVSATVGSGAAYLFDFPSGQLRHTLQNPNPGVGDNFGFAVAITATTVAIGAYRDDAGAFNAGTAYQFDTLTGSLVRQLANPSPSDLDYFGAAVAIADSDPVVGAYWDDAFAVDAGTTHVFDGATGNLRHRLASGALSSFDQFGSVTAISGHRLVVGALTDDEGATDAGRVFVYDVRDQSLLGILQNPTPFANDNFGNAVAIDGNLIAVGEYRDDEGAINSGVVHLFDATTFNLIRTIVNPAPAFNSGFGFAIALEGNTLAVGAYRDSTTGTEAGSVHLFDAPTGQLWQTLAPPAASDFGRFGSAIALQNNLIVVGAPRDDHAADNAGSVYVMEWSTGQLLHTIRRDVPADGDNFGRSLDVAGTRLVVGANRVDLGAQDAGAAYLYDLSSGVLLQEIENPQPALGDFFGASVDLSSERIAVGAPFDTGFVPRQGAVHVFDAVTAGFQTTLIEASLSSGDNFGASLSLNDEYLVAGAPQYDGPTVDRGAVLIFDARSNTPPDADAGGPYVGMEGTPVVLDASASVDAESPNSLLNFEWDLDYDGTTFDIDLTGSRPSAIFPDNFLDRQIAVRVTDPQGLFDIATSLLTVTNVPPELTADADPIAVDEGLTASNAGTYSDAGADDTVSLTASVGTVVDLGAGQWHWSWDTTDGPDDSQTVTITATDDDGGVTHFDFILNVNNVAPSIAADSGAITVLAGTTAVNQGSYGDPGIDTISLASSVGDIFDNGDGTWSWSFDTTSITDSQIVVVTVTDSDMATTEVQFDLTVSQIVSDQDVTTVPEGSTAENTGQYLVTGTAPVLSATIGTVVDNLDGTWSWSYDTLDGPDETQVVTVTADYAGDVYTTDFQLQVDNVPPQLTVDQGTVSVDEGQSAGNTGTFSDAGVNDVVTLTATLGTVVDNLDGTWSWSFDTLDGPDDSQVVTITATDNDGGVTTSDFTLDVANVAPQLTVDQAQVAVLVGATAVNSGTYSEPGVDTVLITASFGMVVDNLDGTWSWSGDTTSLSDSQLVTITITDSDMASTQLDFDLVVSQVAVDTNLVVVGEGSTAANTGQYLVTGTAPVLSATLGTVVDLGSGNYSWSWDTTDGPDDSQPVTITADYGGGQQFDVSFDLLVDNVPPQLTVDQGTVSVDEGQSAGNTGTFSDAGVNDVVTLTATLGTVVDNLDGTWSWSFDTLDGPDDSQVVTITATDNDGGVTTSDFTLDVANVAPQLTVDQAQVAVLVGATAVNSGTYSEPGVDTVSITASAGGVVDNLDGTWSWSLATMSIGDTQLVTITITDSDMATSEVQFDLTVSQIVSDQDVTTVPEGSTAANTGQYLVTGTAPVLSATVGTVVDNLDGTWSWSYDTLDGPDETQVVTVTADYAGDVHTTDFQLQVANVAPQLTVDASLVQVVVGTTAVQGGTYNEPGADTVTLTASFGMVVDNLDGTWSWSGDTTSLSDTQLVTITITDSDNASTQVDFDLLVSQVAVDSNVVTVGEGATAANTGQYLVTGTAPVLSATLGTVVDNLDGTWSWSYDTVDGPDETQVVTVTADYGGGQTFDVSFDLVVENVPPQLTVDQGTVSVDEGQSAGNTGTFSDAGVNDVVTLTATLGTVVDNLDGTWSWSFDTLDGPDDSQVVTITATDNDGGVTTSDFTLDVANVAPQLTVDQAQVAVLVGATAVNSGTYSEPGVDTVSITASVGDVVDNLDGTWSWSLATTSVGDTQLVTITITDSDMATTEVQFDLTVSQMVSDQGVTTVPEGSTAANTGQYLVTGTAPVLSATLGTVVDNLDGTWSWSFDTLDGPDDSQVVTVTADYAGDVYTTDFQLQVDNVAPVLTVDASLVQVVVGTTAVQGGTYNEPGADTVTLTASFGMVVDNLDGTWSWSGDTTSLSDSQLVTITITDSDMASTQLDFDLVVSQVAVDTNLVVVGEGSTAANTGQYLVTGTAPVLSATLGTVVDNMDGTWSWSYDTLDGPDETQLVTVTADYAGDVYTTDFQLQVENVPPQLAVDQGTVSVDEGQSAGNTGTFSDAGVNDVVTLTATVGTVVDNLDGTWSWSYDTTDGPDDSQVVTITATDNDGGVTTSDFTLDVANVAPELTVDSAQVAVLVGATAVNSGTYSEPGADTVLITASVGDVVDNLDGTWSWSLATTSLGDTQLVTITITDSDMATTEVQFDLTVSQIVSDQDVTTVPEGSTAANTGQYLVTGTAPVLTATLGTVVDNLDGTWSWSYDTLDGPDDSQVVTVTADYAGDVYTTDFQLQVDNVAPVLTVDASLVQVVVGATAVQDGTYNEPGADTVTLTASFGMVVDNLDGTWSWSGDTTSLSDSQLVTITITDSDMASTQLDFDLVVSQVAVDTNLVVVGEGSTAANTGQYLVTGTAPVLSATLGTVVDNMDGTWSWSYDTLDGPDETQLVTVTADYAGDVYTTDFQLQVENVPPQLTVDQGTVSVDEGQSAGNTGTFSDAGVNDVVTLTATLGTVVDNLDGTWSWSFDTLDGPDDSQVVTITATDNDGGVTTSDFTLDVANVAPELTVDSAQVAVLVGATAVNSGTYSEPGVDTVLITASVGDVVDNGDGTWSWSLATTSLGDTQLVTITITDSDNATTEVQFDLTVSQIVPDQGVTTVPEGSTAENTGQYLVTGTAPVLSATLGTVVDNLDGTWSWSYDTLDGPDETQVVTVTADYAGDVYTTDFLLQVENVPPQLTVDQGTVSVDEGQSAGNTGTFSDAGVNDVVTLTATLGTVVDNLDGTWSWSYDTLDGPDESQLVTITATDGDGGVTTIDFMLDVANLAPQVTVNRARVGVRAGNIAVNGGTYVDPGADTVTITASIGQVVDNDDGTWSWSLDTTSLSGSQLVTITITDSDNQVSQVQFTLFILIRPALKQDLSSLLD